MAKAKDVEGTITRVFAFVQERSIQEAHRNEGGQKVKKSHCITK